MREKSVSLKRTRLAVFFIYCCQGLIFSSWASRIPDLKLKLGVDDSFWGTLLLMLAIGQIIGMSMSGFVVSKFGGKKILLFALPLATLILLPISLANNVITFGIALILSGIFGNFMNISANTQGISVETKYGKSIMSSFHGGWSLGGFAGSLIGLLMVRLEIVPFYHFIIVTAIVAVVALLNIRYLPSEELKSKEKQVEKQSKRPEKFLYLLGLVAFCGMFVEGTMFDWSGVYFKDIVKVKPHLVPLGFAVFMMMMASGRFISDRCADKWGRSVILRVGGILSFSGLLLSVLFPYLLTSTIGFMMVGLGVSSMVPMLYSITGQKTKMPISLALTVVSSISFLGFLIGPPVIGYISGLFNLRYSFAFACVFAIIILILTSQINVFKKEK